MFGYLGRPFVTARLFLPLACHVEFPFSKDRVSPVRRFFGLTSRNLSPLCPINSDQVLFLPASPYSLDSRRNWWMASREVTIKNSADVISMGAGLLRDAKPLVPCRFSAACSQRIRKSAGFTSLGLPAIFNKAHRDSCDGTAKGELLFGDPHRSSRRPDFFHQMREMDANVSIAETHDLTPKLGSIATYLQLNVDAYLAKAAC